jgi:hypothetical protein
MGTQPCIVISGTFAAAAFGSPREIVIAVQISI